MATVKKTYSMSHCIDEYLNGEGWQWGRKDCIGLMLHLLNKTSPRRVDRHDYIPVLTYGESLRWLLSKFADPLVPYRRAFADAGLKQTIDRTGPQIILVYGGRSIISTVDDERYPVHVVPGVIFQPSVGLEFAFMRSGMKPVILDEYYIDRVHRYKLPDYK